MGMNILPKLILEVSQARLCSDQSIVAYQTVYRCSGCRLIKKDEAFFRFTIIYVPLRPTSYRSEVHIYSDHRTSSLWLLPTFVQICIRYE